MSDQAAISAGRQVIVSLGDKPLGYKLDLVTALLTAVRDAHRVEMTPAQWHEINGALAHVGAAMERNEGKAGGGVPICTRWHQHMTTLKPAEGGGAALTEGEPSPLEAWLVRNPARK